EDGNAESLRTVIEQPGLCRHIFKSSLAPVMPQACRRSLVRFGCAVGFSSAVQRAKDIGLWRPLDVVGDYQIQKAVFVVVHPRRAGAEFVRSEEPGFFRRVGEDTAVVPEQQALAEGA